MTTPMNTEDEELLHAAEHGIVQQMTSIIARQQNASQVSMLLNNCQDFMGRTPIMLAAVGEHYGCIDYLVRKTSAQRVLEALLACIEQDLGEVSQYIIKHPVYEVDKIGARIIIGESGDIFYNRSNEGSLQFSSDITPIILAAQKQQIETLKLLLQRGARIERPHKITCNCTECGNRAKYDSLKHSRSRLNAYRGLTSPSYIALTASDPITEAFRLSGELRLLSGVEKEFKAQYLALSDQCKAFAVELVDYCRNTREVCCMLNGNSYASEPPSNLNATTHSPTNDESDNDDIEINKNQLDLLNLAFRYDQKSFVAHASCQQQVGIFWCNGIPSWQRRSWLFRAALISGLLLAFPFISVVYMLIGAWQPRVARLAYMPLIKFIMSIASELYFVVLLVILGWTSRADTLMYCTKFGDTLASPIVFSRFLIVFWVLGQLVNIVKRLRHKDLIDFLSGWWNYIELATCAALMIGHVILFAETISVSRALEQDDHCVRSNQLSYSGRQIYNCLLSFASILTFVRVTMTLFQASESFGPLQISLSRLVPEITKFIIVFVVLISSFNIALLMIFREYPVAWSIGDELLAARDDIHRSIDSNDTHFQIAEKMLVTTCAIEPLGMQPSECISDEFSTITGTFRSLFWSLFGVNPREASELLRRNGHVNSQYSFLAEYSGSFLFGSFHVISLILINILIAALAFGYTEIREDEDTEWKYARTKLRLSYIEQKNFTQPPFNILPSASFLMNCLATTKRAYAVRQHCTFNQSVRKLFYSIVRKRTGRVNVELQSSTKHGTPDNNKIQFNAATLPVDIVENGATEVKQPKFKRNISERNIIHGRDAALSSAYERLMTSLTTRWMHYKFYNHMIKSQRAGSSVLANSASADKLNTTHNARRKTEEAFVEIQELRNIVHHVSKKLEHQFQASAEAANVSQKYYWEI